MEAALTFTNFVVLSISLISNIKTYKFAVIFYKISFNKISNKIIFLLTVVPIRHQKQ